MGIQQKPEWFDRYPKTCNMCGNKNLCELESPGDVPIWGCVDVVSCCRRIRQNIRRGIDKTSLS